MKLRWVILLLVLIPFFVQEAMACNGNGVCEEGENAFCGDCTQAFCGNGVCDVGAGETVITCREDCGRENGASCSSGGQCQSGSCNCGTCGPNPPPGFCCSSSDCPAQACDNDWSYYCGPGGDVWGTHTCYNKACISNACEYDPFDQDEFINECTATCADGSCCDSHEYFSCYVNSQDIYWFNSCDVREELRNDCSDLDTINYGPLFCGADGNVYKTRTTSQGGCNSGDTQCSIVSTNEVDVLVSECPFGCEHGQCIDGCQSNNDCTEANECQVPECNTQTGACNYPAVTDGTECSIGVCIAGQCQEIQCTDNDADGVCDDVDCDPNNPGVGSSSSRSCGSSIGACVAGTETCTNGDWGSCQGAIGPSTEVCDSQDNDCDGQTDEGFEDTWIDGDRDGFGDSTAAPTCLVGTGYANNNWDCNDESDDIHPDAIDYCGDGVDSDCSGDEVGCTPITCPTPCEPIAYSINITASETACSRYIEEVFYIKTPVEACTEICLYNEPVEVGREPVGTVNEPDGTVCGGGLCQAGMCLELCPEEPGCFLTTPQNAEIDDDYACAVGSCFRCRDNFVWDGNACVNNGYSIDVRNRYTVPRGNSFTINPITTNDVTGEEIDAWYAYSGYYTAQTSSPVTIQTNKIGKYSLTLKAYRTQLLGTLLAQKNIEVHVTCTASDQCCRVGDTSYTEGMSCTGGICTSSGACIAPRGFESIHHPGTCSDGIDNDRDGLIDCQIGPNGQVEPNCGCQTQCVAPQTACGTHCYDLQTDERSCGICGNSCESNELCIEGACVFQGEECHVTCLDDEQCGGRYTCENPGTCLAECKPQTVLQLEELEQTELLSLVIRQRTNEIKLELDKKTLKIINTNLVGVPLRNFTVQVTIPKQLAATAGEIGTNYPIDVIHADPVIAYTIPELVGKEIIELYLPNENPSFFEQIIVGTPTHANINLAEAKALQKDELAIIPTFTEGADGTTISLDLIPGKKLTDVTIPLEIPKCMAESMNEITFKQQNYAVINDDPLMVWTFDTLNTDEVISFAIPKTVDDNCKEQLRAFGLAGEVSKPINPWLPLSIIPIIGLLLVFFQRFHEGGAERHLSKKEFFALGKEQGHSPEDLERAWHDYQRRF